MTAINGLKLEAAQKAMTAHSTTLKTGRVLERPGAEGKLKPAAVEKVLGLKVRLSLNLTPLQMTLDILAAAATGIFWKGVKLTMRQI